MRLQTLRGVRPGASLALVAALVAAPAATGSEPADDDRAGGLPALEEVLAPDLEPGALDLRFDPASADREPLDLDLDAALDDLSLAAFQDESLPDAGNGGGGPPQDQTGTDPRDFSSKLMPYYRYTELENGVEVNELTLFGMYAFTPNFAMTFEWALLKNIDYSDLLLPGGMPPAGGLPPGNGFPGLPSGGVPPFDLDPDGDETGIGDLNLRFFYVPESWRWIWDEEGNKSVSVFPVLETTLPTATEDALGGDAWILSPGITIVTDLPGGPPIGLGFFAMMNFIDFDVVKDNSRESTTRFRGRWFWMQPISKPGPGLTDGLYVLTEFQPVYDFMESDFDLWIGPEFGKIIREGFIIYGKPGWGIDTEPEDRDFSFEFGMRYFF